MTPRPEYAGVPTQLRTLRNDSHGSTVLINERLCLHSSLPVSHDARRLYYHVPRGTASWFALAPPGARRPTMEDPKAWRERTLERWQQLHDKTSYDGPYARQVKDWCLCSGGWR